MRLNNFASLKSITFEAYMMQVQEIEGNWKSLQTIFHEFKKKLMTEIDEAFNNETRFYQVPDDFTMLRFLQADDYRIDAAIARLLSTMKWRLKTGLDEYISNPNQKLIRRYRQLRVRRVVGIDKNGCALVMERVGEFLDSDEAFRGGLTIEQWLLCYSYDVSELLAAFREATENSGRIIHRMNFVGDLTGLSFTSAIRILPSLKVMTKHVETSFPEICKIMVLS